MLINDALLLINLPIFDILSSIPGYQISLYLIFEINTTSNTHLSSFGNLNLDVLRI